MSSREMKAKDQMAVMTDLAAETPFPKAERMAGRDGGVKGVWRKEMAESNCWRNSVRASDPA